MTVRYYRRRLTMSLMAVSYRVGSLSGKGITHPRYRGLTIYCKPGALLGGGNAMADHWTATASRIEAAGPAAPLTALPAISLDLETTGLLPQRDYIIQIGAIAIVNGAVAFEHKFESLVKPPIPIPQKSVQVHRITDTEVGSAPTFAEVYPRLREYCGSRTLIGFSVEFDLGMLAQECTRHAFPYREPTWLDVRLLAAAISGQKFQSLDELADRYQVSSAGRHSALADARMTAEIYLKLLPDLRDAGVRTYGQARAKQESISRLLPQSGVETWRMARENSVRRSDESGTSMRTAVDGFIFRNRLADLMQSPAITIRADRSLQEAARQMRELGIGSLVVQRNEERGIVTHADMARVLAEHGEGAASLRVSDCCSWPLETMPAREPLYRAVARMARRKRRHIGVTDDEGLLTGMISLKTILRDRSLATLTIGDRIETASTAHELASAMSHLPRTAAGLFDDRLDGREIAEVISAEGRAITRRAAELAGERMQAEGLGPMPAACCLLVLGSGGRGESMLAPDQDNALIVDDSYPGHLDDPDDWFTIFARHLNSLLDEGGVPLCKGGVMARERDWRKTLTEWASQVDRWIANPKPENILNVDIFYDMVPVHGDRRLASQLERHAWDAAAANPSFARAMGQNAGQHRPPLGLFGQIRTNTEGRVDLKGGGLLPIVSAARAMALRHGVRARSTTERLKQAFESASGSKADLEGLLDAHEYLVRRILRQQIADISTGRSRLDNSVVVSQLSRRDKGALAETMKRVSILADILPTVLGGS